MASLVLMAIPTALPVPAEASFPGKNGLIAFQLNGQIHTMNPDGTNRVSLGGGRGPRWSPDGSQIAFVSGGLAVMDADGSDRHVVVTPQRSVGQVAWSSDGTRLVYSEGICDRSGCDSYLRVVNADGSGDRPLATLYAFPSDPDWSPDGRRIAYWEASSYLTHEIYVVNPDGTGRAQLTSDGDPCCRGSSGPSWSPNGQKILFTYKETGSFPVLRSVHADGSNPVAIPGSESVDPPARWSPDGQKILFSRYVAGTRYEIWVMNADGSGGAPILSEPDTYARWPDWQPIPINSYPRPKGATPIEASLVPAYARCMPPVTTPNRMHGPPLETSSCKPPTQTSDELTLGSPDANGKPARATGEVTYQTLPGNPATTATDEADVRITVELKDVYKRSTPLVDYTGELRVRVPLRITDKLNPPHPGGPGAATVSDTFLGTTVSCTATADSNQGADCNFVTSADALVPGTVTEGKRAVWELGQVQVDDGGADGDADTAADNTLFMVQGVFVP